VKSIFVWVYKNNLLINNAPFLSIISAGKYLQINRKIIRKYLDTNIPYNNYYFYSKENLHSITK
jgi:hypothetical protein